MGLTKDYLRYVRSGVCNIIGSPNGAVQCVDDTTSAVAACESVVFYNMRTLEKSNEITSEKKTVTAFKMNRDKSVIAVGYNDGEIHLHKRNQGEKTAVFAGHRTGVNCLAFSNDGLTLASGGKVYT
ncbi:WD repeat-containing protein 3 [Ditylenchus destructor]|nr:WD repeat-containing protein 3 [Ditylenchus destructor]